jgi:hypothetical protein
MMAVFVFLETFQEKPTHASNYPTDLVTKIAPAIQL